MHLGQDTYTSNSISVYPNPTSSAVYFDIPKGQKCITIEVLDMSGRVMGIFTTQSNSINIESLQPGLYLLKFIIDDKEYLYSKFVKNEKH